MGKQFRFVLAAAMLAVVSPVASAKEKSLDERSAPAVDKAFNAIQSGNPADAVATLAPILDEYEKFYAGEKRRIFCAEKPEQTITYMTLAVSLPGKKDAIAINPGWCAAQFVRAFALVDLKKLDEAQAAFEKLIEFAPQHARYLNELGYVLLQKRQWQASIDAYTRAEAAAALTPARRDEERCASLRGIGYDLVELGRLDAAEESYRKCLEILPNDAKSLGEIEYINQQRKKTT